MPSSNLRYAHGSRSATAPSIAAADPILSAGNDVAKLAADARIDETNTRQNPTGARSVQTILERSFSPGAEEVVVDKALSPAKRFVTSVTTRRFLKIAFGIALVIAFGWAPLRAMLATTSVEAIVNARIETIRAPIEGIVQAPSDKTPNWSSTAAPAKLTISNPYADRSRLDELRRDLNTLDSQEETLGRQAQLVQTALDTITLQAEKYRSGRLKLIDARLARQTAELQATAAKTRKRRPPSSAATICSKRALFRGPTAIGCNTNGTPRPLLKPRLRSVLKKRKSSMTRSPTACSLATVTTIPQARFSARPNSR
jgi:hypothetical protein